MKTLSRLVAIPLLALFALSTPVFAQTTSSTLTAADQKQISGLFTTIESGIRTGGTSGENAIKAITSAGARSTLDTDIFYGLPFAGDVKSVSITNEVLDPTQSTATSVRYNADISIKLGGNHSDFTGTGTYFFTFKKEAGKWYLFDTDFYKGLGSDFSDKFSDAAATTDNGIAQPDSANSTTDTNKTSNHADGAATSEGLGLAALLGGSFLVFALIIGALCILSTVFWIWMMVAVATRPNYEHKLLWILLMIFTGLIGSVLYYFMEHRAYRKSLLAGTATMPASVPATVSPAPVAPMSSAPVVPASETIPVPEPILSQDEHHAE
jgi:hypothetical protein